jgi:uroporphyrinogen decarboxylase
MNEPGHRLSSKDRFFATLNREQVDRPASWLGLPTPDAIPGLLRHFGTKDMESLKYLLQDDIWPVEVPYDYPPSNHIACAFDFAKTKHLDKPDDRTLTAPGFFEDYTDPADVDRFDWPDPSKYLNTEEAGRRARQIPPDKIAMGVVWSAHFQDACSAFGMETALVQMMMNPEMFRAVINRITEFYLQANAIFYNATRGYLDCILIGNDFGAQDNMIVAPESLREFVFPGTRLIIEQAKSYGLKVIHHSCGSIFPIIDDLIYLGADAIHPIQALARDMQADNLKEHFGDRVAFCGGVDAQELLVRGTPEMVHEQVLELKELFPTGLIISPSHEAILPDIPPQNVQAMFEAIHHAR